MTREMKLAIVEDILTGIVCSEVWSREQLNDTGIVENTAQLEKVMHTVSKYLPEAVMCELDDAITNYTGAYEQAAILFGIHTADALREITAGINCVTV